MTVPHRQRGAHDNDRDEVAGRDLGAVIDHVHATAYRVPTPTPEADGTFEWSSTTLVVVEVAAAGLTGFGYTYAGAPCAALVDGTLAETVRGSNAMATNRIHHALGAAVRNLGRPGMAACAISAIDTALWDLKARLLGVPLVDLFGAARDDIPVYGSGGFTNEGPDELLHEIDGWRRAGIRRFQDQDRSRSRRGREADQRDRRVARRRRSALRRRERRLCAEGCAADGRVDGRARHRVVRGAGLVATTAPGLRFVREHAPPCTQIAAGEYALHAR